MLMDPAVASVPDETEPDPAWRVEKRMFLQRLWEELQQLPRNQRAALLLNLKETSGFGCITLFPATGIATRRWLADTQLRWMHSSISPRRRKPDALIQA
jgi:hypothetical protein